MTSLFILTLLIAIVLAAFLARAQGKLAASEARHVARDETIAILQDDKRAAQEQTSDVLERCLVKNYVYPLADNSASGASSPPQTRIPPKDGRLYRRHTLGPIESRIADQKAEEEREEAKSAAVPTRDDDSAELSPNDEESLMLALDNDNPRKDLPAD
jgi:hypothetical protein